MIDLLFAAFYFGVGPLIELIHTKICCMIFEELQQTKNDMMEWQDIEIYYDDDDVTIDSLINDMIYSNLSQTFDITNIEPSEHKEDDEFDHGEDININIRHRIKRTL